MLSKTILLTNYIQKVPKQRIFAHKFRLFFFFFKILKLEKLEGADFKHEVEYVCG